jgi:hypothetical protein
MLTSLSTQEQPNSLAAFRQTIHESGFTRRKDAQFELLDALLLWGPVRSFAELSLSPIFHRKWPSVYAALEDGRQDETAIRKQLAALLPSEGTVIFPLDASFWRRPCSPTLPDRQYGHGPSPGGTGDMIQVGYPYSILAWAAEVGTCWTLPLDVERIGSETNAVSVGVLQIQRLLALLPEGITPVFVADGGYGNHRFLHPLKDERCGVLVRLRKDRVLYRTPGPYSGSGRPRKHGERLAFKEPPTWGEPDERMTVEDPKWGRVEIQSWGGLHAQAAADTVFTAIRVQTHTERETLPEPLWLAWKEPTVPWERTVEALWRTYPLRWGIEPSIRWRKQDLGWTLPQVRTQEACDRWTTLVTLAQWELFLARPWVADAPLPWQKPRTQPTPSRVQRRLGSLFAEIGSPARPPQTRGKPPGWPKGKPRNPPQRYRIVKKTAKTVPKRSHSPPAPAASGSNTSITH